MDFDEAFSFQTLLSCYKLCRRNKQHKDETINFELNISRKLCEISSRILNGGYNISSYRSFKVFEPKERVIDSLSFYHRIVQRSLCDNILAPKIEPRLIYDNAACRKNKGTSFAVNRLEGFIKAQLVKTKKFYFLQCDIKKYFQSIRHDKLKEALSRVGFDHRSLRLINQYIDSYSALEPGRGIPIGNQTSQWFALLFLDPVDRLIKEQLRVKYYVRYMDDFVLISEDKEFLRACLEKIRALVSELGLTLNAKTQINNISKGISFLGFRFVVEGGKYKKLLRSRSKVRIKNNLTRLSFLYRHKAIDDEFVATRLVSYKNHYRAPAAKRWLRRAARSAQGGYISLSRNSSSAGGARGYISLSRSYIAAPNSAAVIFPLRGSDISLSNPREVIDTAPRNYISPFSRIIDTLAIASAFY